MFPNRFAQFLSSCQNYNKRPKLRVILDSFIWLLIPAVVSGFFYIQIAVALCKRKRNATRNTTLTICFAISWIMWLACWLPNYISLILLFDREKFHSMFMLYLTLFRTNMQMAYSHFNPVIFIIVMKPFQIFVKNVVRFVFMQHSVQEKKNGKAVTAVNDAPKEILSKLVYGTVFALLAALIAIQASSSFLNVLMTSTVKAKLPLEVQKYGFISVQKRSFLEYAELMTSSVDPRNACGSYHGTFQFAFRRCYFVQEHNGIGLNFTEQVDSCSKLGAVLFYATSKGEIDFVWDSVYIPFRSEPYKNSLFITGDWFLHLGYVRTLHQRNTSSVFTSIDSKMEISFGSHYWFSIPGQYQPLSGPSVCILEVYKYTFFNSRLYQCLPRMKARFSVCVIDYVDLQNSIVSI